MALWGKADSIYSTGTVTVNYSNKTITGSGTSFLAATVGSVITIGAGGTFGQAVISGISSQTQISIATTQYLSGAAISGVAYTMSQKPVYTLEDTNYNIRQSTSTGLTNFIEGVDQYEAAALTATGSNYSVAHAGWVGVHTYTDMHGNVRVKSETLVAMSGISSNTSPTYGVFGDAEDDATLPDRFITIAGITASPSAAVGVGTTVTLTVSATATPSDSLSYQWQKSTTANGTTYTSIDGATTAAVSIANTDTSNNNYKYRVIVTSSGGATATSSATKLTVTA
jgi:hypothetical protein